MIHPPSLPLGNFPGEVNLSCGHKKILKFKGYFLTRNSPPKSEVNLFKILWSIAAIYR